MFLLTIAVCLGVCRHPHVLFFSRGQLVSLTLSLSSSVCSCLGWLPSAPSSSPCMAVSSPGNPSFTPTWFLCSSINLLLYSKPKKAFSWLILNALGGVAYVWWYHRSSRTGTQQESTQQPDRRSLPLAWSLTLPHLPFFSLSCQRSLNVKMVRTEMFPFEAVRLKQRGCL